LQISPVYKGKYEGILEIQFTNVFTYIKDNSICSGRLGLSLRKETAEGF
jgi:hypothetical protein